MGYYLKNARTEKSIWKILKWQSLRSLALKSKFILQFEFLEKILSTSMENDIGEQSHQGLALQQLFPSNLHRLFKLQTVIKSHSLMAGVLNLAIFMFLTCFFLFQTFVKVHMTRKFFLLFLVVGFLQKTFPSFKSAGKI